MQPGIAVAVYDMDRTITRRASWAPWLIFYARTEAPLRLLLLPVLLLPIAAYALKVLDRAGLKQATQRVMMGSSAPRRRVERAAGRFAARFGARFERPQALAAMAADRAAGRQLVIATASSRFYVAALARRWGVEQVVATENVWEGDSLTPLIAGENCYGMAKLVMLLAALGRRPPHVRFLSDHESDLPALLWADTAVAVSPTAALRRLATAQATAGGDWSVCDWA